jgi:prepilin-type N-terminal cleavage/methylation domain-containing protein
MDYDFEKTGQNKKEIFSKGYTLIELLIVVVSVSLLFSLGYAGYRDYARRQQVESYARKIIADLRYTQEIAISGKKPASGCTTLNGYLFDVQEAAQRYVISPVCDGATYATPEKTETVPSGLAIRATGGLGDYALFNVLARGTNVPPGSPLTITIGQTAQLTGVCIWAPWDVTCTYSNPVDITVTSTGEIY